MDPRFQLRPVSLAASLLLATAAHAITAVSGSEMRAKGQTGLGSVLEDTPAVNVQASPQGGQVYVRGVGANGDSNWVDPAVSINLDGIYSGRAERVFSSMYDVSRVEVLRGPQGTLYGRNATGGSVNVLTNNPKLDAFEGGVNTARRRAALGAGRRHADGRRSGQVLRWLPRHAGEQPARWRPEHHAGPLPPHRPAAGLRNLENKAQVTQALPFGRVQVTDPRTVA
jgi:outer membrane receptor protein involved in Fe transport